jgi:hypothetical protein
MGFGEAFFKGNFKFLEENYCYFKFYHGCNCIKVIKFKTKIKNLLFVQ